MGNETGSLGERLGDKVGDRTVNIGVRGPRGQSAGHHCKQQGGHLGIVRAVLLVHALGGAVVDEMPGRPRRQRSKTRSAIGARLEIVRRLRR